MNNLINTLKREAKLAGITLAIDKGRKGKRGEITLEAPTNKQFAPELHGLVTEQQDDPTTKNKLEAWDKVVEAALQDLRNNLPLSDCPSDCPCKQD